jgi:predicted nucleotidyltransferase
LGSHAYGRPTAESDVDLLVVTDKPVDEMETMVEIAKSLPILTFGVDVVVRSRKTLERRKKLGDRFLREITPKGKFRMNELSKEWVNKADADFYSS